MTPPTMSRPHCAEGYVCLDFRREKLADPKRISAAAHEHVSSCVACQAFARRIDKMEGALADELSVQLPEGLNERILLRVNERKHGGRKTAWRAFALAASVLVTVAISLKVSLHTNLDDSDTQLAQVAAAHANDEASEINAHHSLKADQFGLILANFGGALQQPLGQIRYIHFCPIEGFGMGWHIAYDTPKGKVTLLLVPGQHSSPDTQTVTIEGMQVRVQRAGQGFYALITRNMSELEAADHDMKTKVRWKS